MRLKRVLLSAHLLSHTSAQMAHAELPSLIAQPRVSALRRDLLSVMMVPASSQSPNATLRLSAVSVLLSAQMVPVPQPTLHALTPLPAQLPPHTSATIRVAEETHLIAQLPHSAILIDQFSAQMVPALLIESSVSHLSQIAATRSQLDAQISIATLRLLSASYLLVAQLDSSNAVMVCALEIRVSARSLSAHFTFHISAGTVSVSPRRTSALMNSMVAQLISQTSVLMVHAS